MTEPIELAELTNIIDSKAYRVVNASLKSICETDDIFLGLAVLKKEPPGSKLIRCTDKKTLAYTTAAREDELEFMGVRERPMGRRRRKQRSDF